MTNPTPLSPAEITQYREQGFLGPLTAFDEDEMAMLRDVVTAQVLPVPTPHSVYPTHCRHLDSETVHRLCTAPAIVEAMASLFGPDLVLWASAFFDKSPEKPEDVQAYPWHQDTYNWRLEPMESISAWLALTPATIENGCVEVLPGSHKEIIPPITNTDREISYRFAGVAADPTRIEEERAVPMVLRPGQFFLFNERTLHRSQPNRSAAQRLGLTIRATAPHVKSNESWPCMHLRGDDPHRRNAYAEPPAGEPDARWRAEIPEGDAYAFDRPVPGLGWHLPERDGNQSFAWMGAARSWIELRPASPGPHRIQIDVLHAITPAALDAVDVRVDGASVRLARKREATHIRFEGPVPSKRTTQPWVRIEIRTAETARPCDVNPGSRDNRLLGLGISRIALAPRRRALRVPGWLSRTSRDNR